MELEHGRSSTPRVEIYPVKRVIDGDPLELSTRERVLPIRVGIPETKHPGKPAAHIEQEVTAFTRRMVERKRIRLQYHCERQDKSGPQRKGVLPGWPRAI